MQDRSIADNCIYVGMHTRLAYRWKLYICRYKYKTNL